MASNVALEHIAERPAPVDADAIEETFSRIWRESASGDEAVAVRVRALNLIGIARETGEADRFEEMMQSLPQRHPCRGVLAVIDGSAPGGEPQATIAAHCWRTGAGRTVCAEQVTLTAGAGREHALATAVLALLVPEMPVATWLIGDPMRADDLVAEVLDSTDRVLFDSAGAPAAAAALRHTAALSDEFDVTPGDLAWGRLTTWRALIAQFFDGDDGLRRLQRIRHVEIRCADHGASEPLLLAGWLTSRLRLVPEHAATLDGRITAAFRGRDTALDVSLIADAKDTGALVDVSISFEGGDVVSVGGRHAHDHIHVDDSLGGGDRRTMQRLPDDDASLISRALDDGADAAVYRQAAEGAVALLEAAHTS